MEEAVRPATHGDLPALARLADAARAELAAQKGGDVYIRREARRVPTAASLADDLAAGGRTVLAGTLDGAVVGYGVGHTVELVPEGLLGVVTDIYVEPEAREVGIGELLLDRLVAGFAEAGCAGVDVHALPGARETKNFFEGAGFTARLLVLHHRLIPK